MTVTVFKGAPCAFIGLSLSYREMFFSVLTSTALIKVVASYLRRFNCKKWDHIIYLMSELTKGTCVYVFGFRCVTDKSSALILHD